MMSNWLQKIIQRGRAPQQSLSSSEPDEEIPVYPPFAKGLPAVSSSRVLTTQAALLRDIRQLFPMTDDEYASIVEPAIRAYAAFAHLLPASEAHHHRGAGGLLHHGLEVAFLAGRAAAAHAFQAGATPLQRKHWEPRWRLAIFLAGLYHDIGKPVTDLEVVDRDGGQRWTPLTETIEDWALRCQIQRYYLRWVRGRKGRHEVVGAGAVSRLLPKDTLVWLGDGGGEATMALIASFQPQGGAAEQLAMGEIVKAADRTSVARDLARTGEGAIKDPGIGVPVEGFILTAARHMIASQKWTPNKPGGPLWLLDLDGDKACFLVWKTAAENIIDHLREHEVPGISRSHDVLADILIERGLARQYVVDAQKYRYWPIAPQSLSAAKPVRLYFLRLTHLDELFDHTPPFERGAIILNQNEKVKAAEARTGDSSPASPPTIPEASPEAAVKETVAAEPIINETAAIKAKEGSCPVPNAKAVHQVAAEPVVSPPIFQERAGAGSKGEDGTKIVPDEAVALPARPGSSVSPAIARQAGEGPPSQVHPPRHDAGPAAGGENPCLPLLESDWLGRALLASARDIAEGRAAWGEMLCMIGEKTLIRHPEWLLEVIKHPDSAGAALGDAAQALIKSGWIMRYDPGSAWVWTIAGVKGFVVCDEIARSLSTAADGVPAPEILSTTPVAVGPSAETAQISAPKSDHRGSVGAGDADDLPALRKKDAPAGDPELVQAVATLVREVLAEPPAEWVQDEGAWRSVPKRAIERLFPSFPLIVLSAEMRNWSVIKKDGDSFLFKKADVNAE